MSPISIQRRIQALSLAEWGSFLTALTAFFTQIRGDDSAVPSLSSTTAITHTTNTDTKTFMAVQKSILEMEVHVVSFMMGKMNSDYV